MNYNLSAFAVFLGLICGILMPFIANYLPIKSALAQNLRTSLDLTRGSGDGIGVKVQKLSDVGMSANQLLISILLVIIGFGTFYFLPLSFTQGHITLFFMILGLILVLVVVGLTFLCTLLFSSLEKLLLWITLHTCCRRDKHIYSVVVKNLESHSPRNNKTSIMFNLAVSFLIFSASSF
mmetsp:Transcript_15624/g.19661  ORF Transcript_15624/g.19661 Transcript_15624/m.19661 type:complete len:179 (+) Transcript_15624:792-1328(+)